MSTSPTRRCPTPTTSCRPIGIRKWPTSRAYPCPSREPCRCWLLRAWSWSGSPPPWDGYRRKARGRLTLIAGPDKPNLRAWPEQSQVAQRGDDGVYREAGLQNGENPAHDLEGYYAHDPDDLSRQKHSDQVHEHDQEQ